MTTILNPSRALAGPNGSISSSSSSAPSSPIDSPSSPSHPVKLRDAAMRFHSSLHSSSYPLIRTAVHLADALSLTALSYVPTPVVQKATAIGNPLVDAVDSRLSDAYTLASSVKSNSSQAKLKVLSTAQVVFDQVLPPVIEPDEDINITNPSSEQCCDKQERDEKEMQDAMEEAASDAPLSFYELASHVNDRLHERGIIQNVTCAATQGTILGVSAAAKVARPFVVPMYSRVQPYVEPMLQRVQPYVEHTNVNVHQARLQMEAAFNIVKSKLEALSTLLMGLANHTKVTMTHTVSSFQNNVTPALQHSLVELSNRLSAAAEFARHLPSEGKSLLLEHKLTRLSLDYAVLLQQSIATQVSQFVASEDKQAALLHAAEEARVSLVHLMSWMRAQLAHEQAGSEGTSHLEKAHRSEAEFEKKEDELKEQHRGRRY